MKYIITENQFNFLISEEINYQTGGEQSDIVSDFTKDKYAKWFDYKAPSIKHMRNADLENSINYVMNSYLNQKYKLKRVLVKDDGQLVGFLIYSITTPEKENIKNKIDENEYPILLSTAISPEYRNRGLLKKMIEKANIQKPFLVQTSALSTPGIWKKLGCEEIYYLGQGNSIEFCN
jgi:Acetyltransferase (GNAT) family